MPLVIIRLIDPKHARLAGAPPCKERAFLSRGLREFRLFTAGRAPHFRHVIHFNCRSHRPPQAL